MFSTFSDELRPARAEALLGVMARVRVLATEEGGRKGPFTAHYRPNHNFGAPGNRNFFIGEIQVPEGQWVYPGETHELTIIFLNVAGLPEQLTKGRRWRIQEGSRLVAMAELLSILTDPPNHRV